jgi:hypothetical protein
MVAFSPEAGERMGQTRPRGLTNHVRTVVAVAALLLVTVPLAPASSATTSPPAVTSVSLTSDATSVGREARDLRRETAALLTGYLTQYGDRFTAAENDQLRAYQAEADRTLAGVVVTTKRLQTLATARAPRSQILSAGRAAQRAHQRARAAAQTSYEGARRIMEPRLSLFEGIGAIRDYDAMLDRFDELGDRIDAVVARVD